MSGLKINVENTRAIWIGSMNRSNCKLCLEYNLDWNQEPFKIDKFVIKFEFLEKVNTYILEDTLGFISLD